MKRALGSLLPLVLSQALACAAGPSSPVVSAPPASAEPVLVDLTLAVASPKVEPPKAEVPKEEAQVADAGAPEGATEQAQFGMIGLISGDAANPPWGKEDGVVTGDLGQPFGAGGLGVAGVGNGGGGAGQGLGLGGFGQLGHGARATGLGAGHRVGGAQGVPTVRQGAPTVNGRLPPEVIQRIVRQSFGRFRLCYETGLRADPRLAGRVTVRFTIARDGSTAAVAVADTTLSDQGVVACVVRGFSALSYPQPEGGIVVVTFPVIFAPGDPAPPPPPPAPAAPPSVPRPAVAPKSP